RKHFSAVKGGKLRKMIKANEVVALLVSDVNTGDFKTLASNPLFPEAASREHFQGIAERYKLLYRLPFLFQRLQSLPLKAGAEPCGRRDAHVEPILLAGNSDVVKAAEGIAQELGYLVQVDRADDEAPLEQTAARLISLV